MNSENIKEAIKSSEQLLNEIEIMELPIEKFLMKAKRIAQLIEDKEAQKWFDFELNGYPEDFDFSGLGKCCKYITTGKRSQSCFIFYSDSAPKFESMMYTSKIFIDSNMKINDTKNVMEDNLKLLVSTQEKYFKYNEILSSIRSSIHSYTADVLISLKLGNISENIFSESRNLVDEFVRNYCPKAAEQLVSINDRILEGNIESFSQALTSCRRLLLSLANTIFPSRDEYIDKKGKKRKVGVDDYKNRILAFLENSKSVSSIELVSSELEYLAARLDAVYEKTCKGVHVDVNKREAKLTIISTYILISEIAYEYKFQNN